jgi:hypothetical protein
MFSTMLLVSLPELIGNSTDNVHKCDILRRDSVAVLEPFGNVVGLIEESHFKLPST